MTVTDDQKSVISGWIREGMKLADIQKKMQADLGLSLTYMEVRLLVDDLKLMPKDVEPPPAPPVVPAAPPTPGPAAAPGPVVGLPPAFGQPPQPPAPEGGGVRLHLDQVTRPGTLASGGVRFSDGQTAKWYLDQMGRLGMAPDVKGYRPSQADVEEFQLALERELTRLGM